MIEQDERPILIDTHAHLDDGRFERDLAAAIDAAAEVGVHHIINIGYRPARWPTSIALADSDSRISFTLGLHPHHADEFTPAVVVELGELIEKHRPVAIGEIGLDYFRDFSDRDLQRRSLAAQLELAATHRLPVVIHMRGEVEDDLRAALEQASVDIICVLHSFDGSPKFADWAVERGYLFGVGGLATRPSNTVLREIIGRLPLDRVMLETDSPYLAPAGVKDRRNTPANIPVIAATLATLRGMSLADSAQVTTANAERVFGLTVDKGQPLAEATTR